MADLLVYIYNHNTGMVIRVPKPIADLELKFAAWHGPFNSQDAAVAWYNANKQNNWKAPTNELGQVLQNAEATIAETVTGAAKDAITPNLDKFGPWFIRIGEVLLGLVLIGVGLAKLTGTTNLIAKTAKAVIP